MRTQPSNDQKFFLDVEASGLHATSYPVEVAWVSHDLSAAWSALIRPAKDWGEADWSWESEKVHGISRNQLLNAGLTVADVAARLNADLADQDVLTNNPVQDSKWLARLYDAAGLLPSFAMMAPAMADAQWRNAFVGWQGRKVLVDFDILVTNAASRAGVAPDEHELFAGSLNTEVGIVPHRALDDAVAHALSYGAVAMLEMANEKGDGAARDFRMNLVGRARRLLEQHGRRRQDQ
jgi:hypothetical protein